MLINLIELYYLLREVQFNIVNYNARDNMIIYRDSTNRICIKFAVNAARENGFTVTENTTIAELCDRIADYLKEE